MPGEPRTEAGATLRSELDRIDAIDNVQFGHFDLLILAIEAEAASPVPASSDEGLTAALDPELRAWADRFALTGVEWLHEVNKHISHEGNAPVPPDNSWLALEGCNHGDCRMGRKFKAALAAVTDRSTE